MEEDLPVRQRIVSAREATAHKPNGAASSVFEAGRQAKPPAKPRTLMPPLDVAAISIRKGVPLPPPKNDAASPYRALLESMAAGDSVVLLTGHAKSAVSRAKKLGLKVATRQQDETHTALWRVK